MEPLHMLVILSKAKYISRKKVNGKWYYKYHSRDFTGKGGEPKGKAYNLFSRVATGSLRIDQDKLSRDAADYLVKEGLITLGKKTQTGQLKEQEARLTLKGEELAAKWNFKGAAKPKNRPDSTYDPEQLKMGTAVEMEHGLGKEAAKEIAKDHLEEMSDYYTRLKKMEAKKSLSVFSAVELLKSKYLRKQKTKKGKTRYVYQEVVSDRRKQGGVRLIQVHHEQAPFPGDPGTEGMFLTAKEMKAKELGQRKQIRTVPSDVQKKTVRALRKFKKMETQKSTPVFSASELLEKAKYISRKKVKGKWRYVYNIDRERRGLGREEDYSEPKGKKPEVWDLDAPKYKAAVEKTAKELLRRYPKGLRWAHNMDFMPPKGIENPFGRALPHNRRGEWMDAVEDRYNELKAEGKKLPPR
jgi:hypothetical protein